MSKVPVSLSRALSLASVAGLLIGCPAVEPELPEPAPIVPQSGVWGMHIADLHSDGFCERFAPAVEGRVVRLDIESDARGELYAEVLGLGLYGGHGDGFVWADAELSLPYYGGGGWDEPVPYGEDTAVSRDEPSDDDEETDAGGADASESDCAEPHEGDAPGTAPPRVADVDEEVEDIEAGCGDPEMPEPSPSPEPVEDAGIYVSLDAELRDPGSMRGALIVTISNGRNACSFEADIEAAHLGEDARFDDEVVLIEAEPVPGHGAEPKEASVSVGDDEG